MFEILITGGIIGIEFRDRTRVGETGEPGVGRYNIYRFHWLNQPTYCEYEEREPRTFWLSSTNNHKIV